MKFVVSVVTVLLLISALPQSPWAQAGTATGQVRAILEKVMGIQSDPTLQGQALRSLRKKAIQEVILRSFYFDAMAGQALGSHWSSLDEAKRNEFKTLFRDLFQDSYTRLVLDFLKQETVTFAKEDNLKGRVLVKTVIQRLNEEIPVDYILAEIDQRWLIEDVKIDGVSIVENYQKAFARVIKHESYDGLLRKMRLQQQANEKNF